MSAESLLNHARPEWNVEAMHWLPDVHFAEGETHVWDMNVRKLLNIVQKIALTLTKDFKTKTDSRQLMSGVLKRNLFDTQYLAGPWMWSSQIIVPAIKH